MTERYVAYVRVSTDRQGKSGLGLDAQRRRIAEFVGDAGEVVAWHEEHESGTRADRPELEKALTLCELTGATLLTATLDRLSRDVMFLETVKRRCEAGGFGFKCADMPDADSFILGVMAQVAAYERRRISERTRAALAAARDRGVRLGGAAPDHPGGRLFDGRRGLGAERAGEASRRRADQWAAKRRPVLESMVRQGLSNRGIARELTRRRITTPRGGGAWTATQVRRLRERLGLDGVAGADSQVAA